MSSRIERLIISTANGNKPVVPLDDVRAWLIDKGWVVTTNVNQVGFYDEVIAYPFGNSGSKIAGTTADGYWKFFCAALVERFNLLDTLGAEDPVAALAQELSKVYHARSVTSTGYEIWFKVAERARELLLLPAAPKGGLEARVDALAKSSNHSFLDMYTRLEKLEREVQEHHRMIHGEPDSKSPRK